MTTPESMSPPPTAVDLHQVKAWLADAHAHRAQLESFLRETPRPAVLGPLDEKQRLAWSDLCVEAIYALDHRLEDLMRWRAEELGQHPLFETLVQYGSGRGAWTYSAVLERTRWLAAAIWSVDRFRCARSSACSNGSLTPTQRF